MDTVSKNAIVEPNIDPHATADQLDILVSNAKEKNFVRDREVKHLQSLLEEVESQLD